MVRSQILLSWCLSRWNCRISMAFSPILKLVDMFVIDTCKLSGVISDGWATWATDSPWFWPCPPCRVCYITTIVGWVANCLCKSHNCGCSGQALVFLHVVVSMNGLMLGVNVLVDYKSTPLLMHIFTRAKEAPSLNVEYIHGLAPYNLLWNNTWWRQHWVSAIPRSCSSAMHPLSIIPLLRKMVWCWIWWKRSTNTNSHFKNSFLI